MQFGVSLHLADETVCVWLSPFMFPAFSIPFTCKGDGEARKEKSWQEGAGCFQRLKNCCMKWESEKSSYLRMTCFLSVCKCVLDNVLKPEHLCIRWFRSWHAPFHTLSLKHTHIHLACSGLVLQWADREKLVISIWPDTLYRNYSIIHYTLMYRTWYLRDRATLIGW